VLRGLPATATTKRTHRQARSISYRMSGAKFPVLKDIGKFVFADTPIDEDRVRELATGSFLDARRNVIFIGGTGTGKTHLCIGVAAAVVRARAKGRFFNLVDLVNQLEQEKAAGRTGRLGGSSGFPLHDDSADGPPSVQAPGRTPFRPGPVQPLESLVRPLGGSSDQQARCTNPVAVSVRRPPDPKRAGPTMGKPPLETNTDRSLQTGWPSFQCRQCPPEAGCR
jgi:hypothetical protein